MKMKYRLLQNFSLPVYLSLYLWTVMQYHDILCFSSQVQSVADTAQLVATPNKDAVAVSYWLFDLWIDIFLKYLLIQHTMYCLWQVYGPLIERYKKLEEEVVNNFNSSIQKSWIYVGLEIV